MTEERTDEHRTVAGGPGGGDEQRLHGHEQHQGRPHGHEAHETEGVVSLMQLGEALIGDIHNHPAGRTAKTILSGTSMRAVLIAMAAGAELAEHDSPPAATLQVVTGKVTLSAGDRSWELFAGQVMPIPPQRHSVRAEADSAVLLTVALR